MLASLIGNQVFAGFAGAAAVSGILFQLRRLPGMLWALACDQFTATVTVYSEQDAFRHIDLWMARHPSAGRSRRLALAEWWDQAGSRAEFEMAPGAGPHVLWDGRRPILVNRQVEQQPNGGLGGSQRRQTITLSTIGRSRARLEKILGEARTVQDRNVVSVYIWSDHGYELVERRRRRDLASVFLAGGLRDQIVADAQRFVDRREWYAERGLPHRRGYLFEGPPGTGKSSMALALAGALHRAVYIVNPATVTDDNSLQKALNQAGSGVVLIEDIDAIDCGRERAPRTRHAPPGAPTASTASGISTSGLLNAIDGVAARDGRILIITTNHAEALDPALIRPGRIDMRSHFGPAGRDEALAMFRRFCPELGDQAFLELIEPALPMSQAELQNQLLRLAA